MTTKPNILLVHGHDMGRSFSPYGYKVDTPNVERLAAEGVILESLFCPAPQCSPSRASLMTGQYPHVNGMMGLAHLGWQLKEPERALPHRLKRLGYETYLFGLQHEASQVEVLGYDHVIATETPNVTGRVTPPLLEFLASRDSAQPFFASVGFFEAHRPFDLAEGGYTPNDPDEVAVPFYLPDTKEVRRDVAAFNSMIRAADDALGQILDALDRASLEDTLLIFTTDHGVPFPRAKGTLYDAGLEIAGVVRWIGEVHASLRCDELLCNLDLLPTLLEAAGGEVDTALAGQSFLPLLRGEAQGVRDDFMCEMTWHDRYAPVRGIRTKKWKYIKHFEMEPQVYLPDDVAASPSANALLGGRPYLPSAAEELYDLESDPYEQSNLAKSQVETAQSFRERLERWMQETNDPLLKDDAEGQVVFRS